MPGNQQCTFKVRKQNRELKNQESYDQYGVVFTPTHDEPEYRIVPKEKRYLNMKKQGHLIVKFEKQNERKFCFLENPFPGDGKFEPPHANEKRFDPPEINIEASGKHRNTSLGPIIGKYSNRKELWPIKDLPDSQIYNH
jgi:hypothetical protein